MEHRLEDVLYRDVDRIVLMDQGQIVSDLHPDELLSSSLLREHGIREPLYLTALRYAGVDHHRRKSVRSIWKAWRFPKPTRSKVRQWYEAVPPPPPLSRRPSC